MKISLTPESEQKVKEEVSVGIYPDADTFVNDAIARASQADREKLDQLKGAVASGMAQADRGEFSNRTVQDIIRDKESAKYGSS